MTSLGEFPVKIRPISEADKAFVLSTWKRSYHDSRLMRWVDNGDYFKRVNGLYRRLLERAHTSLIACNPVDDTHVFGWAIAEKRIPATTIVHYVYVRDSHRKLNIARRLVMACGVTEEPIITTHWVDLCETRNAVFRPSYLKD